MTAEDKESVQDIHGDAFNLQLKGLCLSTNQHFCMVSSFPTSWVEFDFVSIQEKDAIFKSPVTVEIPFLKVDGRNEPEDQRVKLELKLLETKFKPRVKGQTYNGSVSRTVHRKIRSIYKNIGN